MIDDTCVIIPVYNEAPVIRKVVQEVCKQFTYVVCVTDGSSDGSPEEIAKTRATLLRHVVNTGQGGALETGLSYAKRYLPQVNYFVTFDGDGQHRLSDVDKMLKKLRSGKYDIVLGSRFIRQTSKLSPTKRILLRAGTWFSNRMSGIKLTDTHNGLRAFNRSFADKLTITHSDMTHASEIIDVIASTKARYIEVPVTIDYTTYSLSKGQSMVNFINIGFDVVLDKVVRRS